MRRKGPASCLGRQRYEHQPRPLSSAARLGCAPPRAGIGLRICSVSALETSGMSRQAAGAERAPCTATCARHPGPGSAAVQPLSKTSSRPRPGSCRGRCTERPERSRLPLGLVPVLFWFCNLKKSSPQCHGNGASEQPAPAGLRALLRRPARGASEGSVCDSTARGERAGAGAPRPGAGLRGGPRPARQLRVPRTGCGAGPCGRRGGARRKRPEAEPGGSERPCSAGLRWLPPPSRTPFCRLWKPRRGRAGRPFCGSLPPAGSGLCRWAAVARRDPRGGSRGPPARCLVRPPPAGRVSPRPLGAAV
ncbi:uncharacterized protein LOC142819388 [Pelodiscus sinensis]|uniref:uncharacterized protein LOC142819388 n=1 Tax=Pelodiscus sinensis TaxID=13735 RepID=UPI003F6B56B1